MSSAALFILNHQKRNPREMGVDEIRQYLSHLATDGNVAASTQNVALAALLFLCREVVGDRPVASRGRRARQRPQRIPVVLTAKEVRRVLSQLTGTHCLMASLLYGGSAADGMLCFAARQRRGFRVPADYRP
ncbi:MAG: phage integrase N-terminal SAM-like domain-containing protein [Pyrinomonadaceae bacterium]|nr:phage integrase N-terminal SAM-like domain-containing protein [Pyrinomonadaceae bacterium]